MSTLNPALVYKVPGRLALNPAGFTGGNAAFPHGGKALGIQKDLFLENQRAHGEILDRAKGSVIGAWSDVSRWKLRFTLLQWDPDAYALVYRLVGGSVRDFLPGVHASTQPIVFSPYDVTHPAALLFNPQLWTSGPLPASPKSYFAIPVEGRCCRDASDHDVQIDTLDKLSLT